MSKEGKKDLKDIKVDKKVETFEEKPVSFEDNKVNSLNIFTSDSKRDIIISKDFTAQDLIMRSKTSNRPLWTKIYVELKPKSQYLFLNIPNIDLKYEIFDGEVWFMIGTAGRVVKSKNIIIIEPGVSHTIINQTEKSAKFACECIGNIDLKKTIMAQIGE